MAQEPFQHPSRQEDLCKQCDETVVKYHHSPPRRKKDWVEKSAEKLLKR